MTTTVIALGGNALLRRGDPLDPAIQDGNVERAAAAIVTAVPSDERLVVTHGNGPQVGLLAIADAARGDGLPFPLDVLDAARPIGRTTVAELGSVAFAAGSMGPKVAAASSFTERTGAPSVIGSLDQLADVLAGRAGTRIAP